MPKKLIVVAGEASGDFHAASLIQSLKRIDLGIEVSGIGGERMRQAGCKILFDISELAIIGFTDVLKNLKKLKQLMQRLLAAIDSQHPDACILVDYPGFNLKLAAEIKKRKIPVVYYISPQIWAWWQGRIYTIRKYVDKMIVVFKFEEELYRGYGLDVCFVGHPLLDSAQVKSSREEFLDQLGLSSQKKTIGLVPGSRKMEVERILPVLLESAKAIKAKMSQVQFALLQAPGLPRELFTNKLQRHQVTAAICENHSYDFLHSCDFALVASGTATLESAMMQTPMIVVYKVSFLNWLIARWLIKLPYIGLVNVVAGKRIVPEFIQFQAKPQAIAQKVLEMLGDQSLLEKTGAELSKVRAGLGSPGASHRAAQTILAFLS